MWKTTFMVVTWNARCVRRRDLEGLTIFKDINMEKKKDFLVPLLWNNRFIQWNTNCLVGRDVEYKVFGGRGCGIQTV